MELFRSDQYYIFVRNESSLWWNRITGSFSVRSAWDMSDIEDIECLGITEGIIGKVEHTNVLEPRLMIIKESVPVGQIYFHHTIYKIKSICFLNMGPTNQELELSACTKHGAYSSVTKKTVSRGLFENSPFFNKTVGAVKNVSNTIKTTTVQAASQVKQTVKKQRDPKVAERLEKRLVDELQKIFDDSDSFYYSRTLDLTNSLQRQYEIEKQLVSEVGKVTTDIAHWWKHVDDRFFWNKYMLKDVISLGSPSCDQWILPIIQGYVSLSQIAVESDNNPLNTESLASGTGCDEKFTLGLISRRSRYQAGTRYNRRGIEPGGKVANYVETEQIVSIVCADSIHRASFVQVRGSVPIFWSQPELKFRPPPRLDRTEEESMGAFKAHCAEELTIYKQVYIVNLVEQQGRERIIWEAYSKHVLEYNSPDLIYVTFDFHEYCRGMHYENVGILINAISEIITDMRFCWRDDRGLICSQTGVFRVNCIDCLDRTNVVQTAIAKFVLELQLCRLGLGTPGCGLPPALRRAFLAMWADNGDIISRQYAGTKALKIEDVQLYSNPKFEERLVSFCRSLSSRSAGTSEGFTTEPGEDGSTILHLAAALGYTKLTTVLLRWRQDDESLALEKEVNLGARDSENCTPLMVASAAGHVETAVVLARWSAGTQSEAGARQAAAAARRAGHSRLAALLDRIHPPPKDGVFLRPLSFSQKGRAGSCENNLVKRPSIDSGINMADAFRSNSASDKPDGHGKSTARWERSMSLPLDSDNSEDSLSDSKSGRRMDLALCETAPGAASPLIDVEALSDSSCSPPPPPPPKEGEQDDRVFTLAEQIIAAMPDRIKNESSSLLSGFEGSSRDEDSLMTPLLEDTSTFSSEFSFEFSDNTYRYCGGSTPCSSGSVSPGSGSALSPPPPSPRPSPAAPAATLQEFLHTTTNFSSLTLNDREQRELYSAAITIQKAYRQYRGRQLQRRAAAAAITIQNCYRRYKQFAYLKQMHAAAVVIQRGYRYHRDRRQAPAPVKRTYSQRRQNQAARKIQQFMRQSKVKLQNARAESARVAQLLQDVHRNSSQHTTSTPLTSSNTVVNYLAPKSAVDADDELLLELLFKM